MTKAPELTPSQIRERCQAEYERAVREGRHSSTFQTVCDGCRQWVDSIYHIVFGTKARLCKPCAIKAGVVRKEHQ